MNVNAYVTALRQQELLLVESLINIPAATHEAYMRTVGEVMGIRRALETLAQQLSDD